ncbi:hypothetical protein LGQ02_07350 [Bacillus shivajii]|uniref:hypothetical protein n=1 Tax=Bacillus shivajii TaxID=1983719 RepID=UPI001CF9DE40|nr:hypothetical protein [Bacillus shivajii]UCZ54563.1 hypothetical protein LGQ02_07350 [Bacillus shivajii]
MKGNKIVFILPALVMAGLFLFGYFVIQQTDSASNETLNQLIYVDMTTDELDNDLEVQINWGWGDLPSDGLIGQGVVEIVATNEEAMDVDVNWLHANLQLLQGNDRIYESDHFTKTNDGIAFLFQNERVDNEIYGPQGKVVAQLKKHQDVSHIEIRYYHHWENENIVLEEHEDVQTQLDERGIEQFWMIQRSVSID